MNEGSSGTSGDRRRYLEVQLEQLLGPPDALRHHLPTKHHPYSLGFAAEAGVRALVRQHLPRTFAVVSGFVRDEGKSLLGPSEREDLSPQTDVIFYDASRSVPLFSIEGLEVVAASDVLGVIEVKDARSEHANSVVGDAIEHVVTLGLKLSGKLRAVVFVSAPGKDALETALSKHQNDFDFTAPHVIYCRATTEAKSYVAYFDYAHGRYIILDYDADKASGLACFLRILTSFMAAQGFMNTALYRDLVPAKAASETENIWRQHKQIKALRAEFVSTTQDHGYLGQSLNGERVKTAIGLLKPRRMFFFSVIGRDASGIPTAGQFVELWQDDQGDRRFGSFFVKHEDDWLVCVEDGNLTDWRIFSESVGEYFRRVCGDVLDPYVFAPPSLTTTRKTEPTE